MIPKTVNAIMLVSDIIYKLLSSEQHGEEIADGVSVFEGDDASHGRADVIVFGGFEIVAEIFEVLLVVAVGHLLFPPWLYCNITRGAQK